MALVSMVASLANSLSSKPPSVSAGKIKPIPYKRLEYRTKAVASHTHSKSFWSAQTCLRLVLGFCNKAKSSSRTPIRRDRPLALQQKLSLTTKMKSFTKSL